MPYNLRESKHVIPRRSASTLRHECPSLLLVDCLRIAAWSFNPLVVPDWTAEAETATGLFHPRPIFAFLALCLSTEITVASAFISTLKKYYVISGNITELLYDL